MKSSFRSRACTASLSALCVVASTGVAMGQDPATEAPLPANAESAQMPQMPSRKWYDAVKIDAFVDTYAMVNLNAPKPQSGQNAGRAFDATNGFAMHWAGLNASYAPEPLGATVGLRFGPGALLYNAGPDVGAGLTYVKQAFVAWKPVRSLPLQIDVGKFDSWIGAESADSQYNMTYTRTPLFYTQPYFHTGLRVDYVVSDFVDLKAYVVNGYNNSLDNNAMKTFGATVGLTPSKRAAFYLNYIGGPEQSDLGPPPGMGPAPLVPGANSRWRHLADAVADLHFGAAHIVVNGDFGVEKLAAGALDAADAAKNVTWYGGNLTAGYTVVESFAFTVRGGYLADPDGYLAPFWGAPAGQKASVVDGSLTIAFLPTPNLIFKLEPRIDVVASDAPGWEGGFAKAPDAPSPGVSKTLLTTTLGVVATTN